MASADDYAAWIVQNADKRGTPEFDTVAKAYQLAKTDVAPTAPPEIPGIAQSAAIGLGYGLDKLAAGLRQAVPDSVRSAVDSLGSKLGMAAPPSIDPAERLTTAAQMQPLEKARPFTMGLSETAPYIAAGGPVGMAGMAALEYGTPAERALNAGGAALGGVAGNLIGKAIKPAVSAAGQATTAMLDKFGINALPSQVTGSAPVRWAESVLSNLPGGSPLRKAYADQQTGFNRAVLGSLGAEGDALTPEAAQAAKSAVGSKFQTIPQGQTVALDDTVASRLNAVEDRYSKRLSPDQKTVVGSYLDDIRNAGPTIPGDVYQMWRSDISRRANSTQDSALKDALTGVYKTLDDAFNRSATGDAPAEYALAREQYRLAKKIEPMATPSGDVSPARVAQGLKAIPGTGSDLSKLATMLKPLQDSGTAQRLYYQALLSGGVGATAGLIEGDPHEALKYGAGSFAAPYLASKLLASPAMRAYLSKGLLDVSPELQRAISGVGGLGGGLLGLRLSQ